MDNLNPEEIANPKYQIYRLIVFIRREAVRTNRYRGVRQSRFFLKSKESNVIYLNIKRTS